MTPATKPIFATVAEARAALAADKLVAVYFKAEGVFVVTAHGSGKFTAAEWRAGSGPRPSVEGEG